EIFYYKVSSTPFEGIGISYCAFTSGSVMSLELWEKLGKFDEELFLDYVDFDMCFRARLSGYKIYAVEKAIMKHTVGNREFYKFLNRTIVLINHSPQRNYYVVRNAYIMRKKYGKQFPEFKKGDKIFMWKRSIKAIFFEKNRIQKFFYILLGILHGFLNKKGKLKLV
ncbi:MAG: hypothetical protein N3A69_03770, partial [Leptospiraceae bacterium]|nr:hypothetical protein [Leptospiraceae bacterium]